MVFYAQLEGKRSFLMKEGAHGLKCGYAESSPDLFPQTASVALFPACECPCGSTILPYTPNPQPQGREPLLTFIP